METMPPHPEERESVAWFGVYPGTVVDDADPLGLARLRVRVPQVYGSEGDPVNQKIPDASLPWCRPCLESRTQSTPGIGDGVWVAFWMGDPAHPVWLGVFLGASDPLAPFVSSYTPGPGPKTRIVRTPNGHEIEMRFVEGEEEIRVQTAGGSTLSLLDNGVGAPKVSLTTPGDFEVTAQGKTMQTYSLSSTLAWLAALVVTAGTTMALTATGVMTLTGASLVLASATGLVSLGLAGAKRKLVTENYITAIQNPNASAFDTHTHMYVPGPPGVPVPTGGPSATFLQAAVGTHSTVNTEAN